MSVALEKIVAGLNKKMGEGTVVLASNASLPVPRILTGSITLDYILGGGWPSNQWTEIVGDASSGKSFLALHTIAANQRVNPDFMVVWIAAEKWVNDYAEMCGVDTDRVYVIENNVMEESLGAAITFAESREVDLIVVDSLPALVPTSEDDKTMEESTVGRHAILINKFFRKVGKATKRSLVEDERPIAGIVINQWRMKIGGNSKYDNRTTPGGEGKNYSYFVRVELRRTGWIDEGTGTSMKRVGQSVRAKTIKNKVGPPQQTAEFDLYFDDGGALPRGEIDFAKELVTLAVVTGVVDRSGGWIKYKEKKWHGAEAFSAAIREEIDLRDEIQSDVNATLHMR